MKNIQNNLIREDSKAGFLNASEKNALEVILKSAYKNLDIQDTEARQRVCDIYEKVSNANAINFDYEDVDYLMQK